jgi:hypothetical protein
MLPQCGKRASASRALIGLHVILVGDALELWIGSNYLTDSTGGYHSSK